MFQLTEILVQFMKNKLSGIWPDNSKYPAEYLIVRFCHYPAGYLDTISGAPLSLMHWLITPKEPTRSQNSV